MNGYRRDPERTEVRVLRRQVPLKEAHIVEIGCGHGRLTRRIAGLARAVVATDTNAALIARAKQLTNDPTPNLKIFFFTFSIFALFFNTILYCAIHAGEVGARIDPTIWPKLELAIKIDTGVGLFVGWVGQLLLIDIEKTTGKI